MAKGQQPLPILNRINEETGEMLLMNYKMNASNAESFADALKSIVPETLKKMALIDNRLTDDQIARIFKSLGSNQLGGLSSLCLI